MQWGESLGGAATCEQRTRMLGKHKGELTALSILNDAGGNQVRGAVCVRRKNDAKRRGFWPIRMREKRSSATGFRISDEVGQPSRNCR